MAGALSVIGAILTITGTALVVALLIDAALRTYSRIEERFRPHEPSDDVFGDIPNVSGLTNSECVDALHRSGDRP